MSEEGKKFDAEKLRFSLIPQGVLFPVIKVLEFGAKKYSENNWRHVENARTRYFDAAHRHLDAWWKGETVDSETGESHLAHAICCLMFLLSLDSKNKFPQICQHNWQEATANDDAHRTFVCSKCSGQKRVPFDEEMLES